MDEQCYGSGQDNNNHSLSISDIVLKWIKERTQWIERRVNKTSPPDQSMQDCIKMLKHHTMDIVDFFKELYQNKSECKEIDADQLTERYMDKNGIGSISYEDSVNQLCVKFLQLVQGDLCNKIAVAETPNTSANSAQQNLGVRTYQSFATFSHRINSSPMQIPDEPKPSYQCKFDPSLVKMPDPTFLKMPVPFQSAFSKLLKRDEQKVTKAKESAQVLAVRPQSPGAESTSGLSFFSSNSTPTNSILYLSTNKTSPGQTPKKPVQTTIHETPTSTKENVEMEVINLSDDENEASHSHEILPVLKKTERSSSSIHHIRTQKIIPIIDIDEDPNRYTRKRLRPGEDSLFDEIIATKKQMEEKKIEEIAKVTVKSEPDRFPYNKRTNHRNGSEPNRFRYNKRTNNWNGYRDYSRNRNWKNNLRGRQYYNRSGSGQQHKRHNFKYRNVTKWYNNGDNYINDETYAESSNEFHNDNDQNMVEDNYENHSIECADVGFQDSPEDGEIVSPGPRLNNSDFDRMDASDDLFISTDNARFSPVRDNVMTQIKDRDYKNPVENLTLAPSKSCLKDASGSKNQKRQKYVRFSDDETIVRNILIENGNTLNTPVTHLYKQVHSPSKTIEKYSNGNKLGGRDEGDGDDEISAEEKNELLTLVSNDVTNLLNIIHARNDLIAKKFEECERNENIEYWKGNEGRELNDGSGNGEKRVLALNRWLVTDELLSNLSEEIPWRNMHVTRMNYPFLYLTDEDGLSGITISDKISRNTRLVKKFHEGDGEINEDVTIAEGLEDFSLSYLFVAFGYNQLIRYGDFVEQHINPFLVDLWNWFNGLLGSVVETRFHDYYYYTPPVIVPITIPEQQTPDNFPSEIVQNFNDELRRFVREEGMSDSLYARYNLLDWAKIIDECDDKNLVENEEGRLKLLVEELHSNYGVLI